MAKPDDMPKLVSDDRFKVEALETTARTPGLLSYVRQYLQSGTKGWATGKEQWLHGAHSWMTSK